MKAIDIKLSKEYQVKFASVDTAGAELFALGKRGAVCVVTDDNVAPLYLARVKKSMADAGFRVVSFVFLHGEEHKTMGTVAEILGFLAENKLTRSDTLVALGGGIVGDVTGFVAGIYLRGVDFVQLPTTLLAAVDSSVGGKTGVNLAAGKNLAGVFYQPSLVLCDTSTFATLPNIELKNGLSECVKYAFILDKSMLDALKDPAALDFDALVAASVCAKKLVTEADERDLGVRQILNFGHTVGHALEKCTGYTLPHGLAVAAGMAAITRGLVRAGLADGGVYAALTDALERLEIPYTTECGAREVMAGVLSDKKITSAKLNLIVVKTVGKAEILPLEICEAEKIITMGLAK